MGSKAPKRIRAEREVWTLLVLVSLGAAALLKPRPRPPTREPPPAFLPAPVLPLLRDAPKRPAAAPFTPRESTVEPAPFYGTLGSRPR